MILYSLDSSPSKKLFLCQSLALTYVLVSFQSLTPFLTTLSDSSNGMLDMSTWMLQWDFRTMSYIVSSTTHCVLQIKCLCSWFPYAWSLPSPPDLRSILGGFSWRKEFLKPILHSSQPGLMEFWAYFYLCTYWQFHESMKDIKAICMWLP